MVDLHHTSIFWKSSMYMQTVYNVVLHHTSLVLLYFVFEGNIFFIFLHIVLLIFFVKQLQQSLMYEQFWVPKLKKNA